MMQAPIRSIHLQENRPATMTEASATAHEAALPPEAILYARSLVERYKAYHGFPNADVLRAALSVSAEVLTEVRLLCACAPFMEPVRVADGRFSLGEFTDLTHDPLIHMINWPDSANGAGYFPSPAECRRYVLGVLADSDPALRIDQDWIDITEARLPEARYDDRLTDRLMFELFGAGATPAKTQADLCPELPARVLLQPREACCGLLPPRYRN